MADTISGLHWGMILDRIQEKKCIPFLGAAVNISSAGSGYTGLPLGEEVAVSLARLLVDLKQGEEPQDLAQVIAHKKLIDKGLDKDLARIALKNLARVALHVEVAVDDYDYFIKLLKGFIPDGSRQPSKLLQVLTSLPLGLIVTTNYDRLLENALDQSPHKGKYKLVLQPIDGFNEIEFRELMEWLPTYDDLIVYKIHGTFTDAKAGPAGRSRILVTEEDYIQFLTIITKENVGVPNSIKEKFVDSTLLFLGYSLEDWDFRTLYKCLIEGLTDHDRRASFAIQKDPPEFLRKFWKDKKVTIYDLDVYEFAEQLEKRWSDLPH